MTPEEQAWDLFNELNDYWAEIVEGRNSQEEVDLIKNMACRQDLVLDLCCGTGRHSILLSSQGRNIVGLDVSINLLKKAKLGMSENDTKFPLIRGDMRVLPFKSKVFSAVINMFTSFGYLPSEEEDMNCIKEIARILRRSGNLLLDVVNKDHLVNTFRKRDWGEFQSFYLLEERNLDVEAQMLRSLWIILDKRGRKIGTFNHNLRLYSLSSLKTMLGKAGLRILDVLGGYEMQPFDQNSSRMIIVAGKEQYIRRE